jgi:response regulator NasT
MMAENDASASVAQQQQGEEAASIRPADTATGLLVVHRGAAVRSSLPEQLQRLGYPLVEQASSAQQALDLYLRHQPRAVIIDVELDGGDALDLAAKLMALRRCAVVVVSEQAAPALVERAAKAGVFAYLVPPLSDESLSAALTVSLHRFADHDRLLRENQQLGQTLENRKLIERAKGIYMKHLTLGEPEAHRRLQQESQKRRIALVDLAKKIIESEELLGGGG